MKIISKKKKKEKNIHFSAKSPIDFLILVFSTIFSQRALNLVKTREIKRGVTNCCHYVTNDFFNFFRFFITLHLLCKVHANIKYDL